ncbi:MAG: hypothetical protein HW416_2117 [Chloroflexi bacterium]|nr:hypothetical protein [Chloroflexota bacterium]
MTLQEELHGLVDTLSEKEAEHLLEYLHKRMDKAEIHEAIDEMVGEGSPVPVRGGDPQISD